MVKHKQPMDYQYNHQDNYKLVHDWWHYRQQVHRMCLGMDLYIYYLYKLDLMDIQSLKHIPVDIQYTDRHNTLEYIYMIQLHCVVCTMHLLRKVMGDKVR